MTSFTFILFLPMAAISTVKSELQIITTDVTTGKMTQNTQLATRQPSTLEQLSEIPSVNITTTTSVDRTTPEDPRISTPSLHTSQMTLPGILSVNTERASTLTSSSNTPTVKSNVRKSITTNLTSQTSQRINNSTAPPMLSNITQNRGTQRISTSQTKLNEVTSSFIPSSTLMAIHTKTTSIKPEERKSKSTKQVPGGDTSQPSTSETSIIDKAEKKGSQDSKVVAAIIGSMLSLMIVGFLLIYIRKHRLQKEQTATSWAGPSPLLDGEANNGNVVLGSSNRISLTSFLPQRLSKTFSLLPETNEMTDITSSATLEEKHQGSTFGQAIDGNDAQEK
ncbi:protein EVI2B [Xiphophorus couchianus]|uniref:protein EVI2B n=1 Tax=Xiphophorus couchianus TaxID=32473 RepID=UPI001015EC70|nr:protein EVI2B [Xiphophorus couchianus]XP_027855492.1 protein EVI2B [Xiphophorus couchianus]